MMVVVDAEDLPLLNSRAWKGHTASGRYLKARVGGKMVYLHRLIAGALPGQIVDHINGDTLDNRRANLRITDRAGSNQNRARRSDSAAPFKGITKPKNGRWVAQIMANKRYRRIGSYDTAEEAARAYDAEARRLHGQYARVNFPE